MAAALYRLEIVGLRRLNTAESRAAADDINHNARNVCTGNVGKSLLFQAYSGAGRACHNPFSCTACAVNHIYRRNFALRLEESSADFRHFFSHISRYLCLRRYRVSEKQTASRPYCGLRKRFVTFNQYFCHFSQPTFLPRLPRRDKLLRKRHSLCICPVQSRLPD